MKGLISFFTSTIGRKMLMAITGFVLSGFVLVHMLGNLQFFISPEAINSYAHHLQSLPAPILWGFRLVIFLSVVVHVWMAIWLAKEKADARPEAYEVKKTVRASFFSKQMMWGGLLLAAFVVFHIAHYTLKIAPAPYTPAPYELSVEGGVIEVPDVYSMMVDGFSNVWVSLFYIVSVGFLCLHLSHGFASMFQTMGLRNEVWRKPLEIFAILYGVGVFVGFAALPVSVLLGLR